MSRSGGRFSDVAEAVVERAVFGTMPRQAEVPVRAHKSKAHFTGRFDVECYDSDGNLKWRDTAYNSITNVGLNLLLSNTLCDVAPSAAFYLGLVDNSGFSAFAPTTDTSASHAGWTENTAYSSATRPAWGNGAASGQSTTNASQVVFAMTATATIHGLFCIDNNTKAGTTGNLFSEAAFTGGNQGVNNGDNLKVTYTVSSSN